jgi:uncharacterized protein (DUF1697 family)
VEENPLYKYIALLRGINVGGKNLINMVELKACFEAQGFTNVDTYIQSGNVLFNSEEQDQARLTSQIEEALIKTFNYSSRVVVRSDRDLQQTVANAPKGFGSEPTTFRYDVIFLKEPLTAAEAMQHVATKEGVDQAIAGEGVLYFSRLVSRASQSRLTRIINSPIYQNLTIRNWNTTTRLLEMIQVDSQ